ncbi:MULTISPECIES: RDD family protein [Thermomonospora]|uniref:RDD domain containing protein n=1 Tax=Thermomonospora curvata (strain ATCC 19995 / DSM 43183 / JCM 3096 / KCTC 9072 / NBRC 15933 / NCIMB 10081 / Henssen B9) TaxID=471852 RepID=D1A4D1_THECD|nr:MULTISPECIES: RDD family protein [Thermomonospora]ACZ00006.1 RDD domain containing protein [Thermomonospora curvata DSM 43183]PKK12225.1 MAG: RDD family protein [Thermomonospora sp. CIF 1]
MSDPYRGRRHYNPHWQGGHPPAQWQQQPAPGQWQEPTPYAHGGYGGYQDSAVDLPQAPIHRRALARLMDNALVAVFGFALVLPIAFGVIGLDAPGSDTRTEGGVWNWPIIITLFVVLAILPFIYEAVQLSLWGHTLGKRVLGMSVVRADPLGDPMTVPQAVWRAAINNIGYQIGLFFFLILMVMVWEYAAYGLLLAAVGTLLAYLWAIWDEPLHQAVHDRFADTVVVDDRIVHEDDHYGYDE